MNRIILVKKYHWIEKLLAVGAISFALCSCGHIQIGLVVVNTPALVDVSTKDEIETEADLSLDNSRDKAPQIKTSLY